MRGARVALDGWAVAGLVAVALLGVLVAAWFAWRGSSTQAPVGHAALLAPGIVIATAGAGGSGPGGTRPGAGAPAAMLVVDVAGRVRRPGLVRVPAGS